MKKRLLGLLLVMILILSIVGCGKKKSTAGFEVSDEPVTIHYYYSNPTGVTEYTQQVEDRLNEILKGIDGYEHISMKLYPALDHEQNVTYATAAGKEIDLLNLYNYDINTAVVNGDLICLDELLEMFPDTMKDIPEWVQDYGKIDGEQYWIPTYQQAANLTYIAVPEDYFNMYLEAKNTTREETTALIQQGDMNDKLDFMEDLCEAVREETGKDTKWINPGERWSTATNLLSNVFFNQEYLGGSEFEPLILREGDENPVYWGTTDEFKTLMKRYAEWYQDGLLHPDCNSLSWQQFIGSNYFNDESYVFEFLTDSASEENAEAYMEMQNGGIPMVCIRVTDHAYVPSNWAAGGHAIYADSQHPAEAMMIIELLRSDEGKEFYNTLVWGLEGIHYEWVDKETDTIKTLEFDTYQGGSSYAAYKFANGNAFKSWKNQAITEGYYDYIINDINEGEDTVFSPALGMTWNMKPVKNIYAQCLTVESEYLNTIFISDDWEARYNEYIEALEVAGVEQLVEELSNQYQDYLKSK